MMNSDKYGEPFEVRVFSSKDFSLLEGMYDNFSPKGRFQGLPPIQKTERDMWIVRLIKEGVNYLALREETVIGHAVMLPDLNNSSAECLIFVHQANRGIGIGTILIQAAIMQAEKIPITRLWLIIDAHNIRAMRLYKKCGFCFLDKHPWESERLMYYQC
jgi:RimJ/RimL family protein N-acetyltransferase